MQSGMLSRQPRFRAAPLRPRQIGRFVQERVRRTASIASDTAAAGDAAIATGDYESWSRLVDTAVANQLHADAVDRINQRLAALDPAREAALIARVHAATSATPASWSPLRGPR